MAPVTFSEYEPHLANELVRMWRTSFEYGMGIVDHHPIEEQLEYFNANVLATNRVRVAWKEGELVGFMASTSDSISQLFVKVGHHGQGIGSEFMSMAKAESLGCLWLYTYARNTRACRFYENHGFKVAARGFEPFWQFEDVKYIWSAASAA